jgi:hypothetical protein
MNSVRFVANMGADAGARTKGQPVYWFEITFSVAIRQIPIPRVKRPKGDWTDED